MVSDPFNELITEFWASESLENRFFSAEASQEFLDSFLKDGFPPPELRSGNFRWVLDKPHPKIEILNATSEELRKWAKRTQ